MATSQTASEAARKCLRLHLADGVGPIRFVRILKYFGSIDAALSASSTALAKVDGIGEATATKIVRSRDATEIDAEVELAASRNVRIVCLLDPEYPPALRRIADPPPCLYVRGTLESADAVALAIVGARQCTRYGAEQAERFAALAVRAGLTVVSGLARGIDTAAHRGALSANGRTLAVLGCGLSHLYPPDARDLADRVAASGALLSELAMDTPPDEKNFPRRNRIIAGLSLGTLVVEATFRSGAMITAGLASDYNREVFAVPGRLDTPQADGCNRLIQRGEAKLATHIGDILSELGETGRSLMQPQPADEQSPPPPTPVALDESQKMIMAAFDGEPMSIDALAEAASLSPARVATALTSLQLMGLIRRVGGDHFEIANEKRPRPIGGASTAG